MSVQNTVVKQQRIGTEIPQGSTTIPIADPNNNNNHDVIAQPQYYITRDVEPAMFNTLPKGHHFGVNYGATQNNQSLRGQPSHIRGRYQDPTT